MAIERHTGPRPSCRNCGRELRPNYDTLHEAVGKATGTRRVYLPADEAPFHPPDDPTRQVSRESAIWGTCCWSPRKRQWYRREQVYRVVSRRFLGTFGVQGCGFFCSIECGFRWAVQALRAAERR
jgi:hypothetical protein